MTIYARLPAIRRAANLDSAHGGEDERLLALAAQVSRAIDDYLGYPAYPRRASVLSAYTSQDGAVAGLRQPMTTIDDVSVDWSGRGQWEAVPMAAVVLEPEGAPDAGAPYWRVRSLDATLPRTPGAVRATGVAGLPVRWLSVPLTATASLTGQSVTLSSDPLGLIYAGDTIAVGEEWMVVRGVNGLTLTVDRGVNGTVAAEHVGASVAVLEPRPVLERAMLAWLGRLAWDELAGWQGSVVLTDVSGGQSLTRSTTPWSAVRALLTPYRRVPVG